MTDDRHLAAKEACPACFSIHVLITSAMNWPDRQILLSIVGPEYREPNFPLCALLRWPS